MNPELALFRIGATIAWVDGELADAERTRLSRFIAEAGRRDGDSPAALDHTLATGSQDSLPLDNLDHLVAALPTETERERALKLAYGVMRAGRRQGDHGSINDLEDRAYGRLVALLALDAARVTALEGEVEVELARSAGTPVDLLASGFAGLIGWG